MRNKNPKTAFTLIELIVSIALVAIIGLGIISINMVLSNNNQDSGQVYLVKSATQTTLNHILNNAALAVGSANANAKGILLGVPGVGIPSDPDSFCIHQAAGAGNNLINNASDIWLCYSLSNYQINWCAEQYGPSTVDPRGASSCSDAVALNTVIPWQGNNTTFLGTAFNIIPSFTTSSTQLLFSINIQNCLNNSAPSCNISAGVSSDPANNPEVQIAGSVIPAQEST